MELFRFDAELAAREGGGLAGVDEAGRGPLAGPVVAAAVLFRTSIPIKGLNDSKKLTPGTRESLFRQIAAQALVGIGWASESVIDTLNILEATRVAMREAVLALPRTPDLLLIDGTLRLDLPLRQLPIIGGDARSAAIAAASVMAKVYRDHLMGELDKQYPVYGFSIHKGYPTRYHLQMLRLNGPSPVHRKTFRPVAETLEVAGP